MPQPIVALRTPALLLLGLSAVAAPGRGQDDGAGRELRDLGPTLAEIRARHEVPALGAAVLRDGQLVGLGVAGVRALGHPTPVQPDDRWHLGSCTKAMTATLLARLVERQKLAFDQRLPDLLPAQKERMDPGWRGATLRMLLEHRAGMPGNPGEATWTALRAHPGPSRAARELVLEAVLPQPPQHAPGSAFLYSNTGYMVAGAAAEQATGASWEDLMRELVFTPLGMTSMGFGAPGAVPADGEAGSIDQPRGHRGSGGRAKPVAPGPFADNPPALGPAGTVHGSLRDWARFCALHLGAGPTPLPGKAPFLREATLRELHRPGDSTHALGWIVLQRGWSKGPVLHHAGSNTMWYCVAWLAPTERFGVLVTCNQAGDAAAAACDDAASRLIIELSR